MSLVFGNGSRTVTTGQGGRPYDFGRPFPQQPQGGVANGAIRPPSGKGTRPTPAWASPAQAREPSFGTPYGGGYAAYSPRASWGGRGTPPANAAEAKANETVYWKSQKPQMPSASGWGGERAISPYQRQPTQDVYGDPRGGYASSSPSMRPPPFRMGPARTPWGESMDPFAERDTFIEELNNQRMSRQRDYNNNLSYMPRTWGVQPVADPREAMFDAGLSGGAPSMSPEYGDTLIGRLNDQFGNGEYRESGPSTPPGYIDYFGRSMQPAMPDERSPVSQPRIPDQSWRTQQDYDGLAIGRPVMGPNGPRFAYGMPDQFRLRPDPNGFASNGWQASTQPEAASEEALPGGYPQGVNPYEYNEMIRQQQQSGYNYPAGATLQDKLAFNEMIRQQQQSGQRYAR